MTPLLMQIVLHYYCCANDFRDGDFSAPAVREGIDYLRDTASMLEYAPPTGDHQRYRIAERGQSTSAEGGVNG